MFENNRRLNSFLSSVYVNAVVVLAAVIRFFQFGFANCTVTSHEWQAYELCSNYSYGFIKRAFLGTIVKFLADNVGLGYEKAVMVFMNAEELVFSLLLIGLFLYVINKYKNPNLNMLIVFFMSMGLLSFYYSDWGEQDIVLMSVSMILGLMIVREKFVWAVPIITSICVLIHEGFVMMLFPMTVGLLLIQCIRKEKKERLKYFIIMMTSGFMCGCLAVYCYACSKYVINVSADQFLADAVDKLGENISAKLLIVSFWNVGPRIIENGVPTFGFWLRMFAIALALITLSPLIVSKIRFWRDLIKSEDNKLMRLAYLFCSVVFLFALPLVLSQSDEARWFYGVLFQDFMLIIFLYMLDKEKIKPGLSRYMKTSVANIILAVTYFIVFSSPNKQFIDLIFVIIPYITNWGPLL